MSSRRLSPLPILALLAGPLLHVGCAGGHTSGDRAGTANWVMTISPGTPSVTVGQTLQLTASTPWSNETRWSVVPASAGTITPTGRFTASSTPGTAMVFAVWSKDVRYTASASLTILPPAAPAESTPDLAQASGKLQQLAGTGTAHLGVTGETVQASTARTADGAMQVRHGFAPPVK